MTSPTKTFVLMSATLFSTILDVNAQSIPVTAVPSGFGRYCSVTYPDGSWKFATLTGSTSEPCTLIRQAKPGGTVQRAGLWSTSKNNNVLRTCDGDVGVYRMEGSAATAAAKTDGAGKQNCIFTVAPTALHVFNRPYVLLPNATVGEPKPFDFDKYNKPLKPADFGQQNNPDCPNYPFIDRKGRQRCAGDELAYDWGMPRGTPIVSVGAGIVRAARWRDVSSFSCGNDLQGEIYVEHAVGTGEYAERFVTYYAHMSEIIVTTNDTVRRGQMIGRAGATGCAFPENANHLHFGVFRTTNLSGYRKLDLTYPDTGYGVSAIHGAIDPFGWDAPQQIDPWAWAFLGTQNDGILGTVTNPGAFSLYLWRSGQAPRGI